MRIRGSEWKAFALLPMLGPDGRCAHCKTEGHSEACRWLQTEPRKRGPRPADLETDKNPGPCDSCHNPFTPGMPCANPECDNSPRGRVLTVKGDTVGMSWRLRFFFRRIEVADVAEGLGPQPRKTRWFWSMSPEVEELT